MLDRVPFNASKSIDLMTAKARRRGRYRHNTQQTQQTNIHDLSRIRTSDPSNQAAAGLRLFSITQFPSLFPEILSINFGLPYF
jgi:hypothetical protein